jgi:hypothetical protein
VPLPHRPIRKAYLATLDPIDGDEAFSEVDPIGSRSVPTTIQLPEMMVHLNEMNEMLIHAANLRGAKRYLFRCCVGVEIQCSRRLRVVIMVSSDCGGLVNTSIPLHHNFMELSMLNASVL